MFLYHGQIAKVDVTLRAPFATNVNREYRLLKTFFLPLQNGGIAPGDCENESVLAYLEDRLSRQRKSDIDFRRCFELHSIPRASKYDLYVNLNSCFNLDENERLIQDFLARNCRMHLFTVVCFE